MLIALVGPPQSGKHTVANYLVHRHGFRIARVATKGSTSHTDQHAAATTDVAVAATTPSLQGSEEVFATPSQLLKYATSHWRDRIVTLDVVSVQDIARGFAKRPFFLLVAVEAPLTVRYRRSHRVGRALRPSTNAIGSSAITSTLNTSSFEEFTSRDDEIMYGHSSSGGDGGGASSASSSRLVESSLASGLVNGAGLSHPSMSRSGSTTPGVSSTLDPLNPAHPQGNGMANEDVHLGMGSLAIASSPSSQTGLYSLLAQAHVRVLNSFADLDTLWTHLDKLDLASPYRLRPSWEAYFLSLCTLASLRSNCMKRRVGAVLVRDNRVLSTGYNGTPRGLTNCNEGGCPRCNDSGNSCGVGLGECLCLHAEENTLLECGRERGGAQGTVLYCNTCPCMRCAVKIVQVGVKEVVYQLDYSVDHRSSDIFAAAGIIFSKYNGGGDGVERKGALFGCTEPVAL